MEFTLRDLIYIGTYVSSITGLVLGLRFRIRQTENAQQVLHKIIFREKGGLNVVTNEVCKHHRRQIGKTITRESRVTEAAFDQINCLNQNIMKIMIHMKLEPIVLDRRSPKGEDDDRLV